MKGFLSQRGVSMVQTMVAVAIMGGLAVVSMRIMDNVSKSGASLQTKMDEFSLIDSISLVLRSPRHCRVSLVGEGPFGEIEDPIIFKKSDVDDPNNPDEGLDVSFYFTDQVGEERVLKLANGANNPGEQDKSTQGKIKINSIKMFFPLPVEKNDPSRKDYRDTPAHTDIAEIRLLLNRDGRPPIIKKYYVQMTLSTITGLTTLVGCS